MDSKGQAYSVFKLLIAAVVAMAILLMLFQVLDAVPGLGNKAPNDAAAEEIQSSINRPGTPVILRNILFDSAQGSSLRAKSIALQSEVIAPENVCVTTTDSTPNADKFDGTNGRVLVYKGTGVQRTRLIVVCDRYDAIDEALEEYGYDEDYGIPSVDECTYDGPESAKFCLIAIISDTT